MDSRQARIFDRIQPGLASMDVKDQAIMSAARILADAEDAARGKVDVAQKALIVAQTELDGVRALLRAATGEGATMRTDARLMASLHGKRPPEEVCTRGMLGAHEAHGTCPGSGPLVPAGPDRFA